MKKTITDRETKAVALDVVNGGGGGGGGSLVIKSKSWVGDGKATTSIVLDEGSKMVLTMTGIGEDNHPVQLTNCLSLAEGVHCLDVAWTQSDKSSIGGRLQCTGTYDENTHTLVLSGGSDAGVRFNSEGEINTIYYI